MVTIDDHVYQIEHMKSGQVYIINENHSITMIDTGFKGDIDNIEGQFRDMNMEIEKVSTIIVTHCHIDHTANLNIIKKKSGATIIAHKEEGTYLAGTKKLAYSQFYKKILWAFANLLLKSEKIIIDREVSEGDTIDVYGGLEVIHTPGHTPGSIALYQKDKKLLFSGDCLINEGQLYIVRGMYNQNDKELYDSVKKYLNYDIAIICPGHGKAILQEGNERIKEAIKNY
jgi:glyoxylase-like metal-dependent hydrolase (beta-lactamase superfamily II)